MKGYHRIMRKKASFRERLSYAFDRLMSSGTVSLVGILFTITALVGILMGAVASIDGGEETVGELIWQSFMNILDAGNLSEAKYGSVLLTVMMIIATLCGLFITSILIGIIVSGFEEKLSNLRQGFSRVVESDHTVVIGFNDNIYTILRELIEANANKKKACIVVVDTMGKEEMDEQIRLHLNSSRTTRIITRSGTCTNPTVLRMASLENSGSVIINLEDDAAVIKAILSVTTYLKEAGAFEEHTNICAPILKKANLEAAKIAGDGRAEIVYCTEALAKIIANTCREPGLSTALLEMLSFSGDELYFERFAELDGLCFREVLNLFEKSTVVGIVHNGVPLLNPPMDTKMTAEDAIIHLAMDDNTSFPRNSADISAGLKQEAKALLAQDRLDTVPEKPVYQVLILGYNTGLNQILMEMDEFAAEGSAVVVAYSEISDGSTCEHIDDGKFKTLKVRIRQDDIYDLEVLQKLLAETGLTDILLLNDSDEDDDSSDAKTMLLLLLLKSIGEQMDCDFNVTSEMRLAENQRLVMDANVSDFVVGSTIRSLLLTQISQNKDIYAVFQDMLDEEGSELYFRPVQHYIDAGRRISCHAMTELLAIRGEIFLGYKKVSGTNIQLRMNLPKSQQIEFEPGDSILVIAEN